MRPAQWAALLDAHMKKQARTRTWECRLHGLRHKSGRALKAEDFLPRSAKADTCSPEEAHAAFTAALAHIPTPPPAP